MSVPGTTVALGRGRVARRYARLFSEGSIGGKRVRNRIVMAPMGTELANEDGSVSSAMLEYYEARARGGAGMVTVEYSDVDPAGVASIRRFPPAIDRDELIGGWRALARAVQRHGALAAVQIGHAGRQTRTKKLASWATETTPVAPSAVPCRHIVSEVPRELTLGEIREMVRRFVAAADRAYEARFDAINLHAAHGYLVNAFLSPYSNRRTDEYGGDLVGRTRFAAEIVRGIRAHTGGDLAIIVRLSVDEFVDGGLTPDDSCQIARLLEEAGADAIDVSAAIYDSPQPKQVSPWGWPEASLARDAARIREAVSIPVLVANRIHRPSVAERVLAEGSADFICMGRPLLADPDLPAKVSRGRLGEIRWCISCNECVSSELRGDRDTIPDHAVFCTVNPAAGREREYRIIRTTERKRVLVVGGGLAGLEAATLLAKRGHAVELWEAEEELGGQALLAARVPHKRHELTRLLWHYGQELDRLGVVVRRGQRATAADIGSFPADARVLATGELQRPPTFSVLSGDGVMPRVVAFSDVLRESHTLGQRVLVVGGGFAGVDTTLFLAHQDGDREIILATRWDRVLPKMAPINRHVTMGELGALPGVRVITRFTTISLDPGRVTIATADATETLAVDDVVYAGGMQPMSGLLDAVRASSGAGAFHAAGGCIGADTFLQAIHGGHLVARSI